MTGVGATSRRAVVTGAGSGIGRAIALKLVESGADVVVNDRDVDACEKVAAEIGAVAVPGDAAGDAGVKHLVAEARAHLGGIDVFFANAGVETGAADSDEDWALSWEVNVMSHVRAARELLPQWLEQGSGHLVCTVSAAGLLTMLGSAPYSATKHAALGHAEWLAATYGRRGVTVQCICPLGVKTPMLPTETAAGQVLLEGNVMEPEDLADVVVRDLDGGEFLILPHPEVAGYYAGRAQDTTKWLHGMQKLQARIDELGRDSR